MRIWQAWMACGLLMSLPAAAPSDIFRWDNGQLIVGRFCASTGAEIACRPSRGFDSGSRNGGEMG
jgi:hypothetical protein